MIRLSIYLIKTFLFSWITVTFGFLVLVGLLDSLANGGEIVADGRGFLATFEYMLYRAPVIFDRVLLFTIVVAILLTYVKLIRQHELVSLLSFGLSVPRQIAMLSPAVIGVTALSIGIINTAMPPAVRSLQAWGIGEYKRTSISEEKPLWLQDGRRIIRAAGRPNMQHFLTSSFLTKKTLVISPLSAGLTMHDIMVRVGTYLVYPGWRLKTGSPLPRSRPGSRNKTRKASRSLLRIRGIYHCQICGSSGLKETPDQNRVLRIASGIYIELRALSRRLSC